MSAFISFASGSSSPVNPDTTYEALGFDSDGTGTQLQAGAANALGTAVVIGVTTVDYDAIVVCIGPHSGATSRFMVDLSWDNFVTTHVANLFYADNSTNVSGFYEIPIQVPSGSTIRGKLRSNTGSATCDVAVVGMAGNSTTPPGFTTFTSLNSDPANTRPSATDVPLDDDGSGGWTTLVASAAATYGALIACIGGNGTNFGTAQALTVMLATGAAASEAEFFRFVQAAGTGVITFNRGMSPIIRRSIASASRISAQVRAAVPGTDNARISLYGLS
jgi:hypothetical protein